MNNLPIDLPTFFAKGLAMNRCAVARLGFFIPELKLPIFSKAEASPSG
jgi:hypothetical protein